VIRLSNDIVPNGPGMKEVVSKLVLTAVTNLEGEIRDGRLR
jgi:hypothetical protein